MLSTEIIEDVDRFRALRDEWNELLQSSSVDCIFLTWEWLFTWWQVLSGRRRLHIIAIRRDGRLIGLAPLAVSPGHFKRLIPFPLLEFLGTGSVGSDYLNIIVRCGHEREALQAFAAVLDDNRLMLELRQVDRTARPAIDLALELKRDGWVVSRTTTNFCPLVELSGHSWESYLATLGSSHRYNFRRRLRKLEREFDVRFEDVTSEPARREAVATLVALHRKRWRTRGGSDALHTEELVEFHRRVSRKALIRRWLRLFVLRLDSRPAAALYGFRYNGIFYFYQSGFDPDFSKYSVGLVAMGLAIKRAIEERANVYDMLHGDEEYKFHWARDERELCRLELFPPRPKGVLYEQAIEMRWAVKKMIWRLLPRSLGDRIAPGRRLDVYWNVLRKRRAA